MSQTLAGKTIAILATDGVERVELQGPRDALRDAGAEIRLVSLEPGSIKTFDHLDQAGNEQVDETVADADPAAFDGLLIPGGVANGDLLRDNEDAVRFVTAFAESKRPIAAICHAPWILIEAGIVKDRTVTSWPSLRTDLENAGAEWVDEEVVVDQGLVTSRKPDDIPAFSAKAIEEFAEGAHEDAPKPDPAD
ncbi:MAG: type 1 glutamine amidotransferase domain-containing protein [Baekduia sp.]